MQEKVKSYTASDFEAIYERAEAEGRNAAYDCTPTPMIVQQHSSVFDDNSPVVQQWHVPMGVCGFAWINIKPGTSKFARWLKAKNLARKDSYYGGVSIWVGEYGQSMQLKEAYANAFARYLASQGITARAMSRMD